MLRPWRLFLLLPMLLLSSAAYCQSLEDEESELLEATSKPAVEAKPADSSAVAKLIVEKTNEFRAAQQREPVEVSPKLTETAQYFADYMAKNDKYGHAADGNRPSERATRFEYDYCLVSENIAYQFSSAGFATKDLAERFVEGWVNSPGHRKNMLDQDVVETGVSAARSEETGYWYAVQMFGRPASAAVEFKIANRTDSAVEYAIGDRTFPLPPRYTRTHTRCRSSSVTFNFQEDQGGAKRIEPGNDESYYVSQKNGQIAIYQEEE